MKKLNFVELTLKGRNGDNYSFHDKDYNQIWIKVRDYAFKFEYKHNKAHAGVQKFKMECHQTPKGTIICDSWGYSD